MTLELTVHLPDGYHDFLIAELADLDFEAFEARDEAVVAWGPARCWSDVHREHVEQWLRRRDLPVRIDERVEAPHNWNETWEASIAPVVIGPFLVRPSWHATPPDHADKILLEIDPKMSFGTGYHESTRLALRFLPGLVEDGARVLDAGTGTGILAIAALKLGAAEAYAFDIDPWSIENAAENALDNRVGDRFVLREGGLEVISEGEFDVIAANINREALRRMLPGFAEKMHDGSTLILAGLLQTDRAVMLDALADAELTLRDEATEGEWWSCVSHRA
ncbi:MAG: 50S ribosomal protein L11 methyltransferase [Bacteroidota bacterium]